MLKKALFAALATLVAGAVSIPAGMSSTEAAVLTCKEAAKLKFPADHKARHAFRKECKQAWKASTKKAPA
ncbi:hypothetical protein [Methyloceanibacter sp.]|uniref:hypothetical protein n=1 Tax=Methyloceanibacter sp. TaxID=1965321 RepID=UPI002D4F419D|nr:hypothetical protein [Methyloceanibacter sp.]HZP07840.1 hypothetical protein [Methyloceanibacter sp.]